MIECPICHVGNDDMARFCAECGQRLSASGGPMSAPDPAPAQTPPYPAPAGRKPQQQSRPKLHSPLLGDDNAPPGPAPRGSGGPDMSRLRGTGPTRPGGGAKSTGKPEGKPASRGLRSPLLAGFEDEPGFVDEAENRPKSRSGLRSPLIGGSSGSGESRGGRKGGGLHSPLLGDSGPAWDDEPESRRKRSRPEGPKRAHTLHSPLLGGGESSYDYDDYDEYEDDEDDPNVLRSPLLEAKVHMSEKHETSPAPKSSARPQFESPAPKIPQASPPAPGQPQPPPVPQQPPVPQPPPQPVPPKAPAPEFREEFKFAEPGDGSVLGKPPEKQVLPQVPAPERKTVPADPARGSLLAGSLSEPTAFQADKGTEQFPDMSRYRRTEDESSPPASAPAPGRQSPAEFQSSVPPAAQDFGFEDSSKAPTRKRLGSRMLGGSGDLSEMDSIEMPASGRGGRMTHREIQSPSPFAFMFIFALAAVALVKGFIFLKYMQNVQPDMNLFLLDQAGGLLVVFCLIFVCFKLSR